MRFYGTEVAFLCGISQSRPRNDFGVEGTACLQRLDCIEPEPIPSPVARMFSRYIMAVTSSLSLGSSETAEKAWSRDFHGSNSVPSGFRPAASSWRQQSKLKPHSPCISILVGCPRLNERTQQTAECWFSRW